MAGLLPRSKTHRNLKARQPQASPGIEDIAGWDNQVADLARGLGIFIGSARDQQPFAQDAAVQSVLAPGSHVVARKPPAIKRAAYAKLPPLIMPPGNRTLLHSFTAPAQMTTRPILSPAASLPLRDDHVPTAVDFSQASSADVAQRQAVADAVRRTLSEYGFLYAVNHGIGSRAQTQARDAARLFFAQPPEDKMQLPRAGKKAGGGYGVIMQAHSNDDDEDEGQGQLIKEEGFTMMNTAMSAAPAVETPCISSSGSVNSSDDEDSSAPKAQTTTDEHTLRRALSEYRTAAGAFSHTVLRLVAMGVGLPEDHFAALEARATSSSTRPMSGLRVARYSQAGDPSGFGTDVRAQCGWLAIADPLDNSKRRRTAPVGLEVVDASMHWTEPPTPPRGSGPAIVVLVGDLLERATNGLLPCTPHRVRFGSGQGEQVGYGLTCFVGPARGACVEPARPCVDKDGQARFEPVRAGDWLDRRLRSAAAD